jgi:signal peptidase I
MATKRKISAATMAAALLFLCLIGLLAVEVGSGQWQIRPVLSGSMRPGFPVGGLAITEREPFADLAIRSVIVTHPPGAPHFNLIHRIIAIKSRNGDSAVLQTMGDANAAPDPFIVHIEGPWIYQVRFTLPLIGYPAVAIHSPRGRLLLLALGILLLLWAAWRSRRGRRGKDIPAVSEGEAVPSDTGG